MRRFFHNRHKTLSSGEASEFADGGDLRRLKDAGFLEEDEGEIRLDQRVERFFEDMLQAGDAPRIEWLKALLEQLDRWIEVYRERENARDRALREITRRLRTCRSQILGQVGDLQRAVDYDFRTEPEVEVKEVKLEWHLQHCRDLSDLVRTLAQVLRDDPFFLTSQDRELLRRRARLQAALNLAGEALIDALQRITDYLNRVRRDAARIRKLLRLSDLVDRMELQSKTNAMEVAEDMEGPWLRGFFLHTALDPNVIEERPEILERVLRRKNLREQSRKPGNVELPEPTETEEAEPILDPVEVYEAFAQQEEDLFTFLQGLQTEDGALTEDQVVTLFCQLLSSEQVSEALTLWQSPLKESGEWAHALVYPPDARVPATG